MSANKYYGLGKRKEAIAKVYLFPNGNGKIEVVTGRYDNYRTIDGLSYFKSQFLLDEIVSPIDAINTEKKYDIRAQVRGGGKVAQSNAIKMGVAYALIEENIENKILMKTNKLLTQDKRFKERKKVGKYGARRSPQFTKR